MKRIMGLGLLVLSATLSASEMPPVYTKAVKATMVTGVFDRATLTLEPGTLENCSRKELKDMILFDCSVKDAAATAVTRTGGRSTYRFDKVRIIYDSLTSGDVRRMYEFRTVIANTGEYPLTTGVRLTLRSLRSAPELVTGKFELEDVQVVAPLQGEMIQ